MTIEDDVLKTIDKNTDRATTFLQELISYPTVTGSSYEGIQKRIADQLSATGAAVDSWYPDLKELTKSKWFNTPLEYYPEGLKEKPVVVGKLQGIGNGKSLILNGHVDVVSPGPLDLWEHDPWKGEIDDGKLFGRGVIDCKGGLAAAISALEAICQTGLKLAGDVVVESVIDEEIGGTGTLATLLRGYKADAGIVTEPSYRRVIIARPGIMWVRVTVSGKSAHAAEVWNGVNAVNKACTIHEALVNFGNERMDKVKHPLFDIFPIQATFNPGTFKAGGYPSSVPDQAILEYRIGTLPGEQNEVVFKEIAAIVEQRAREDDWLRDHPPLIEKFGWERHGCQAYTVDRYVSMMKKSAHLLVP